MVSFVAIDFETGHKVRDSACAIGVVRVENGEIVARAHRLIRPPQDEVMFSFIHGITWRDVKDQPRFGPVWLDLVHMLDGVDFLAAHNAQFDRGVLVASCQGAGLSAPSLPFVCTVSLARAAWSLRPARLPDVARHLGVPLRHHDPLSDAEVCAQAVMAAPALALSMVKKAQVPRQRVR